MSATACAVLLLAAAPDFSSRLQDVARAENLAAVDAQELARGKPVVRTGTTGGKAGGAPNFVEGFILLKAPHPLVWQVLADPRVGLKYSSCLEKVDELGRSSDGGVEFLKVRETHTAMLMTWRYTVDRVHDRAGGVVRWTLDPTAKNDVTEMTGSWRLIPVDERNTLGVLRMSGDTGGALGSLGAWFAERHVPDGLRQVKRFVEVTARDADAGHGTTRGEDHAPW